MRLGQETADLWKKDNLSQEGLVEKMNVSRQAVSKWESEQSIPDIEKIVNLSELFGVTTDYLLKSGEPSFEFRSEDTNDKDKLPTLSDELVKKYLVASQKSPKLCTLATALIIFSSAWLCFACILSIFLDHNSHYETPLTFTISLSGYAAATIIIAIASGFFIYSLLNMREFKQIEK